MDGGTDPRIKLVSRKKVKRAEAISRAYVDVRFGSNKRGEL
jgi:hypothetical protein